ncbi:unnamed protein product [Mytilus edulis]|uniref:FP protein C-terminal domain-containing protein n=1 Tax=Mytilus edulis TaxID=6550 RepID=A0A8S3S8I7_MYTED|nr:unnamed protein product [Mytilus edulis]
MADLVNKDKQSKLDKFINTTPKSRAKRDQPASSPDLSSPSSQQVEKQAKLKDLETSPSHDDNHIPLAEHILAKSIENETVFKLSEVVCATLNNQAFINTIIPMIAEKIMDQVKPKIIEIVDDRIQPYIDTITQNKDALILQEAEMKKQSDEIKSLKSKLVKVESRIEEQEQYSRRTSLRFHNVPVPTDNNGAVITPIDTDDLVLRICNKKLKVKLNIFDIGRSHPIGEMKDGKISIIVRFLSYRQRNMVFSNKKQLKNNPDKIFIAENLTKHRYDLINRLNTLRTKDKIHSFWTHDGTILVKKTDVSSPKKIKSRQDIYKLGGEVLEGDSQDED